MDEIISRWILEFFLHQNVNDRMLNKLFAVLPLPRADSDFKKCMLLKTIHSEIEKSPISEKILTLIEQIEELHFRDGVRVSEAMKTAYCAAAVNCTLRFVDNEGLYMKAVKRIWKDRVCKMMTAEMSGLISEELENWGVEIEEAAWEYSLRRILLEKSKENDAKEVIRVYLAKAWGDLGPSFLEMVSDSLGDEKVREAFGFRDGVFSDFKTDEPDSPSISGIEDKLMDISSSEKTTADNFGEVGVMDNDELESDKSDKDITLRSLKISNIRYALEERYMKLKIVANDPLPNKLNVADSVASNIKRDQEKGYAPNPSIDNDKSPKNKPASTFQGIRIANDTVELEEADTLLEIAKHQENTDAPNPSVGNNTNPKCKLAQSIMEPNSTARTDKWVDSIDELSEQGSSSEPDKSKLRSPRKRNASLLNSTARTDKWADSIDELSEEGSSNEPDKSKLRSPRKRNASLLNIIIKSKKISKRRQKKIWSNIEEDTLRTGVQKYGKGNWKLILNMYREIFEERNEGDLKDKWRNMTK